jgi:hypothetical protein
MPLLLLCLGTILVSRCQPISSPPPSSGSVVAASFHPFSRSTKAPAPLCTTDPSPLPSESGPGTRSSPSAASRPARPQTPSLAGRIAAADCRVCSQAVVLQPSRSCFQTSWFLHLPLRRRNGPGTVFLPGKEVFARRDRRCHHRLHRRGTRPINGHCHRGWISDLFFFQPRPELWGSPEETCLHSWWTVAPVGCTPVILYCSCIKAFFIMYFSYLVGPPPPAPARASPARWVGVRIHVNCYWE